MLVGEDKATMPGFEWWQEVIAGEKEVNAQTAARRSLNMDIICVFEEPECSRDLADWRLFVDVTIKHSA